MTPKPVFLDVDSTIVERNLRITKDPDEEFSKLLDSEDQYPSKLVKPTPGFCIKTKEVGTDTKIFINICQTDAIPPPAEITEEELVRLCSSDEICDYTIPLSIGQIRTEADKKGNDAKAIDVAINPKFFYKVENSVIFKNFFLTVVFEGLVDKHHLHTTDDRVILKNRKAQGTLQLHRIQQREIDEKLAKGENKSELLLETEPVKTKPKIEIISSTNYPINSETIAPKYRLFRKKSEANVLYGEFKLTNILDSKDVTLDVGEDRIILESKKYLYFLDIYLPCSIISNTVISTFNVHSKILTIKMATET